MCLPLTFNPSCPKPPQVEQQGGSLNLNPAGTRTPGGGSREAFPTPPPPAPFSGRGEGLGCSVLPGIWGGGGEMPAGKSERQQA